MNDKIKFNEILNNNYEYSKLVKQLKREIDRLNYKNNKLQKAIKLYIKNIDTQEDKDNTLKLLYTEIEKRDTRIRELETLLKEQTLALNNIDSKINKINNNIVEGTKINTERLNKLVDILENVMRACKYIIGVINNKDNGPAINGSHQKIQKDVFVNAYKNNPRVRDLAAQFDIQEQTVRNYIKRYIK